MAHLVVVDPSIKAQSLLVAFIGQGKGKRLVPVSPTLQARVRAWMNAIVDCIDAISGMMKSIGVVATSNMHDNVMIQKRRQAGGCCHSKLLMHKDLPGPST